MYIRNPEILLLVVSGNKLHVPTNANSYFTPLRQTLLTVLLCECFVVVVVVVVVVPVRKFLTCKIRRDSGHKLSVSRAK